VSYWLVATSSDIALLKFFTPFLPPAAVSFSVSWCTLYSGLPAFTFGLSSNSLTTALGCINYPPNAGAYYENVGPAGRAGYSLVYGPFVLAAATMFAKVFISIN